MRRYLDGLKFGMLLQLAVGPMCLMVFNTAKNVGFFVALTLVLAIAIVDAFYIIMAGLGVSKILDKPKIKKAFKIIGAIVLIIFGINIILNVFNINVIPGLNLKPTSSNIFIQGLVLTLSNPITIVFWGSVLTTKIIENNFSKKELSIFSIGLVSSTLIFLTFVAVLGTMLSTFIPENVSSIMNIAVGVLIIFFGIKMVVNKERRDSMSFTIRNVQEKDLMQVAEICINDWKKAYRGIIDDEYLDSLDVNQKYERFLSNYKEGHFIVADNGEKVLGFCRFCDEYVDNPDDDEIDCELCALYVNYDDRGCGIGAALVQYVKEYFKSIGKKSMIIWCLEENYKARDFYEKMGGKIYGQKEIERGGKKYREVGFKYELL